LHGIRREGNKWNGEGYERSGKVVLSNKGKLTHHEVDSSVKPGYWKLKFFAQKSRISRAILEPSGITQENPHVDFDIVTIQEKVVCQNTSEQKETGYRIKFPGKRFFWIDENTKISSRGSGSTYTISFDQKPTCVIKAERRAAEARRLEAQKRAEEDKIKKAKEELELLRLKQEKLEAIRKAKEALKQQELLEIEQVKNELEGLLDQKVNLESMAGAQAALNYQQRLQLLKDKIALIKYQKAMAKKINGVKGEIEVLTKELTQTEETLTQLKKSKKDQDQLQYMQQRAKIKRRLLDQARQLLGSYQSESSLRQTREKLNARIAMKDTSSGTYVVKQKRYTPEDLEEQKKKYQKLQKKVQEKIVKIQTDIQTIEKEITEAKAHPAADQNNTGDSTVALKEHLLQQAKKLLESYKQEKEENTQVIDQIEDKIKELREKHESADVTVVEQTSEVNNLQTSNNIHQRRSAMTSISKISKPLIVLFSDYRTYHLGDENIRGRKWKPLYGQCYSFNFSSRYADARNYKLLIQRFGVEAAAISINDQFLLPLPRQYSRSRKRPNFWSRTTEIIIPNIYIHNGRNRISICSKRVSNPQFYGDLDDLQIKNIKIVQY